MADGEGAVEALQFAFEGVHGAPDHGALALRPLVVLERLGPAAFQQPEDPGVGHAVAQGEQPERPPPGRARGREQLVSVMEAVQVLADHGRIEKHLAVVGDQGRDLAQGVDRGDVRLGIPDVGGDSLDPVLEAGFDEGDGDLAHVGRGRGITQFHGGSSRKHDGRRGWHPAAGARQGTPPGVRSHRAKRSPAGLLITKSARRRGEIAMQTAGPGPVSPSTAILATLPVPASGHPGNLGLCPRRCGPVFPPSCLRSPRGRLRNPARLRRPRSR